MELGILRGLAARSRAVDLTLRIILALLCHSNPSTLPLAIWLIEFSKACIAQSGDKLIIR